MAGKMSDNCQFSKSTGKTLCFPNRQPPIFYQLCII